MGSNSRQQFLAHLADLLDAGYDIPCVTAPVDAWTSEDTGEQHEIAKACLPCPAFTACRRYIEQHPEPVGVYAGLTPGQRAKRKGKTC